MLEEDACGQSRRQRSVRVVHSAQFSLDGFLVAALADVPLRADYIGADPRNEHACVDVPRAVAGRVRSDNAAQRVCISAVVE